MMLIYSTPYFLVFVIPMSTMMAVLLTFLRLSADNEIIALKTGGLNTYRLLPASVGITVLCNQLRADPHYDPPRPAVEQDIHK
jgi:lipopolysaccharide export system permease protein